MIFDNSPQPSHNPIKPALHSVEDGAPASGRATSAALEGLVEGVQQAVPLMNRASDQISDLAQRGLNSLRDGSQQLRRRAERVSEDTVSYVRVEPVKAILMAAATGAALMALVSVFSRARRRG